MSGVRQYHSLLSPRTREVASFLSSGLTNDEIAKEMSITTKVVESYINHIYEYYGYSGITRSLRVKLAIAICDDIKMYGLFGDNYSA